MERPLDGQSAIVTGAGRGIGRVIAVALAEAGAKVVAAARSVNEIAETVALIGAGGGEAYPEIVDIADWNSVSQMVEAATTRLGGVDLLVQNAGVMGTIGPASEADPQEWDRVVRTNLVGTFHCARAVLPVMIQARRGRIINLMGGRVGVSASPYFTAYQASKAGVIWFTQDLAKETADAGISVFATTPEASQPGCRGGLPGLPGRSDSSGRTKRRSPRTSTRLPSGPPSSA